MRFSILVFLYMVLALVACKSALEPSEKKILSFRFDAFPAVQPAIDHDKHTITLLLPYNSLLNNLKPIFELSPGSSSVPASGVAQDFSKSVYYTLTGADGSKVIYEVLVKTAPQPTPQILGLDKDTLEAGQSVQLKGRHLGVFSLDVKGYLVNDKGERMEVNTQWIDSTQVTLQIPFETVPNSYQVQISVKQLVASASKRLFVSYPSPQLVGLSRKNILQNDTLQVNGKYLSSAYQYALQVNEQLLSALPAPTNGVKVVIPTRVAAGAYQVRLYNSSLRKLSRESPLPLQVYDVQKPFVYGIIAPKSQYKAAETVQLKPYNMGAFPTRFYQIELYNRQKSYVQNGVYDAAKKELSFVLPAVVMAGSYQLRVSLVSATNDRYVIELDDVILINEWMSQQRYC